MFRVLAERKIKTFIKENVKFSLLNSCEIAMFSHGFLSYFMHEKRKSNISQTMLSRTLCKENYVKGQLTNKHFCSWIVNVERFQDSSPIIRNSNRVASSSGLQNVTLLTAKEKSKQKISSFAIPYHI